MRKRRISQAKRDRLVEHFIAGTTARAGVCLFRVHRHSAALYLHRLRQIIRMQTEAERTAMCGGEIEVH